MIKSGRMRGARHVIHRGNDNECTENSDWKISRKPKQRGENNITEIHWFFVEWNGLAEEKTGQLAVLSSVIYLWVL
jgi:hypothetical protein